MLDVLTDYPPQVALTERDDVVEAFLAQRVDHAFGDGIGVRWRTGFRIVSIPMPRARLRARTLDAAREPCGRDRRAILAHAIRERPRV